MLYEDTLYVVSSIYDGWEFAIATSDEVIREGDTKQFPYFLEFAYGLSLARRLELREVVILDTKVLEHSRDLLKHVGLYHTYKSKFEAIEG